MRSADTRTVQVLEYCEQIDVLLVPYDYGICTRSALVLYLYLVPSQSAISTCTVPVRSSTSTGIEVLYKYLYCTECTSTRTVRTV